jgi:hypothetical protein
LDKTLVKKTLSKIECHEDCIEWYEATSLPLENIIERYFFGKVIDLIFIDAEGLDDQVIRTINFISAHLEQLFMKIITWGKIKKLLRIICQKKDIPLK